MCNHVSNLDPPVLLPVIAGAEFGAAEEGADEHSDPGDGDADGEVCAGGAGQQAGGGEGERGGGGGGAAVGAAYSGVSGGDAVAGWAAGDFKKGPFFLAQETRAPIVPVAISGTQTMMRKGSAAIMPGVATVQMLPAIEPTQFATREELMAAVRGAIAEALPEEMKPARSD